MIINVFDRIRIKKSWHSKKLSSRMLKKKIKNVESLTEWLYSEAAEIWFDAYGEASSKDGTRMLNDFKITSRKSMEFLATRVSEGPEVIDTQF